MLDVVVNNLDWEERNRATPWRGRRKEESECVFESEQGILYVCVLSPIYVLNG